MSLERGQVSLSADDEAALVDENAVVGIPKVGNNNPKIPESFITVMQ